MSSLDLFHPSGDGAERPGPVGSVRAARSSGPTENMFDRLARAAADALGVPAAVLALTDERGVVWDGVAWSPDGPGDVRDFPAAKRFAEHVFARNAPALALDVRAHQFGEALGVEPRADEVAMAGVPVGVEGRPVGALVAVDRERRLWSDADVRVLGALAVTFGAELALRSERQRRRAAEFELHMARGRQRESDERYRTLLENATEAIFVHAGGTILYINPAGVVLLGAPDAGALVDRPVLDIVAPEYRAFAARRLEELRDAVHATELTPYEFVRLDGTTVDVEVITMPIVWEGRPALQSMSRDVSQRHRAEAALRESEERYRQLFDASPAPALVYDRTSLEVLAANDAGARLLGWEREEIIGREVSVLEGPEVSREQLLARAGASAPVEARLRRYSRRDGTFVVVEVSGFDVRFAGRDARILVAVDVTDRLRSMALLEASERRYRRLMEDASDAIFVLDARDGRVVEANARATELLGYAPGELVGRLVADITAAEDLAALPIRLRELDERRTIVTERRLLHRDGRRVRVEISASRPEPGLVLAIARDLAGRRQAELVAGRRHEWMGWLAEGVRNDVGAVLTEIADMALGPEGAPVRAATDRARALIAQLAALQPAEAAIVVPEPRGLSAIVRSAAPLVERALGGGVRVALALSPGAGRMAAPAGQVARLLVELGAHARQSLRDGGTVVISTAAASGGGCELRVRAAGPDGTTPALAPQLSSIGPGAGLDAARELVRQIGGCLTSVGAETAVVLPSVAPVAAEAAPAEDEASPPAAAARTGATVLLVDDEDAVRRSLRRVLEREGYRVLTAADTREALAQVRAHPGELDLLLTDVGLPDMDGGELAGRVAELQPDTKVLLMSGYTDIEVWRRGLSAEWPLLQKPFDGDTLTRRVREMIEG